ncbi:class I adenylate-forming enzyme family protein [Streptomyces flavidovirens]|uniref:Class I adenylate-forming enzyme family protein n=1 Tax=Streptomyces flavidovirens TaxID=67298 RepID=A0ABW6RDM1_9ACTN
MAEEPAVEEPAAYEPDVPARLDGLLTEAAAAAPDRTALVHGEQRISYGELDRKVTAAAEALGTLLPGPGGTVAVASVLHPDFAVAYYATARAGQVTAVVNPLLREEDLLHVLTLSGARLAFVDAGLYDRLAGIRDSLPELGTVVLIGEGTRHGLPTLGELAAGPARADAPALSPADLSAVREEVACVQFTSGTTGRPKAVRLTHRNLTVNADQIAGAHRLDGTSVTVNHLPTFHPMHLNSAVRAGAQQVLCAGPAPADAVAAANEHRATHLYSLPVRLARLAADPSLDELGLRTVARIASGGSGLPVQAAARLTQRFGIPVFQGYGLAETSPLTHSDDPDHPRHGSVGRPVAGTRCRVVDVESRAVLPSGSVGEVQVCGPQVMKGYVGGPDGTGLEPDGWLSTGDVGRIDEAGRLFLLDRLKDVFKCDNFLVSPSEVELVLGRHPRVSESVVVDLPDGFGGAVAGALVVLTTEAGAGASTEAGRAAVLAEVLETVNARLPYYQRVRRAQAVDAIPRSGNGKIQRRLLREELLAHLAEA